LEVFELPNHTMGDIAFLDKREGILFSGDVFLPNGMTINDASSVARFAANMRKVAAHHSEFDRLAGGFQIVNDASIVDKYLANAEYILAGHEGDPISQQSRGGPGGPGGARGGPGGPQGSSAADSSGQVVYTRHMPHPGDGGAGRGGASNENLRRMTYAAARSLTTFATLGNENQIHIRGLTESRLWRMLQILTANPKEEVEEFRFNEAAKKSAIASPESCQSCGQCFVNCSGRWLEMSWYEAGSPLTSYR
jgi:hypothetical protein